MKTNGDNQVTFYTFSKPDILTYSEVFVRAT